MLDRSSSFFVISVVEDHDLAKGEFDGFDPYEKNRYTFKDFKSFA